MKRPGHSARHTPHLRSGAATSPDRAPLRANQQPGGRQPIVSGTITFLLTDVEGSTRLWERYRGGMQASLTRHDEVIESLVEHHHGQVVRPRGEGDSRFAVFPRASDAVSAACDIQCALVAENWPIGEPLRVRVALHTGEADWRDGDYYGSDVNRCARLRAVAHGGQTLLSGVTADLVRSGLPEHAALRDLGVHGLKDVSEPERVYQLVHPSLRLEFPPLASLTVPKHNLPVQLTSFVGREKDLAAIKDLVATNRLVTLAGPGGVGKTRLALRVAERQLGSFTHGVWLVELASLQDGSLLPQTVARVLGVRELPTEQLMTTLRSTLRDRKLLLVVDNCEHVVDACVHLVRELLEGCEQHQVMTTTREVLGIGGEQVWRLQGLSLPEAGAWDDAARTAESEAVILFMERAKAAQPDFLLTDQNAVLLAQICRRLDGMPLAIELAAARVRLLDLEQLSERLQNQFRILATHDRTAPTRQQTLQATIEWSYRLLSELEQLLFDRLSVFDGGWSLEAAETVGASEPVDASEILELLEQLVDKSLVLVDVRADNARRYRMLETLRQYGLERLTQRGEKNVTQVRDAHRSWCVRLAEEGERDIWRADQIRCVARLEREQDNVRAALAWTLISGNDPEPGLRIAAAMVRFWDVHGDLREGMRWLADLLDLPTVRPETIGWARATTARAYLTILTGDGAHGIALLNETMPFWRALGDPRGLAMALFFHGLAVAWTGTDLQDAVPTFMESLALAQQRGPRWTAYFSLYCLGEAARLRGDLASADALLSESLALSNAAGDRWGAVYALYGLAFLALNRGDYELANTQAKGSLMLSVELGDTRDSTYALEALGCIAAAEGRARRAARLFGAAAALREHVGDFMSATLQIARDHALAKIRAQLGERGFAAAYAAGRSLSFDQATALAHGPTLRRHRRPV